MVSGGSTSPLVGEGNAIERFYRTFNERTKKSYNNINARVGKIGCLTVFLNLFMVYYNHHHIARKPTGFSRG